MVMTRDEYCEWLKENGNKEEKSACKVVDIILKEHLGDRWHVTDFDAFFEPHKVMVIDDERIEFDLIISLVAKNGYHGYDKKIAVEFKEIDAKKVVWQAARRLWFVDYAYIATRETYMPPEALIVMSFLGIGWIVWNEERAFLVLKSFCRYGDRVSGVLSELVALKLRAILDKEIEERLNKKMRLRKLTDFGGVPDGK